MSLKNCTFFKGYKYYLLSLLLLCGVGLLSAQQDYQFKLSLAEESYKSGNYPDAISKYKSIADSGMVSGDLYFNLGNAYYNNHDYKSAILYYERALKLIPNGKDIAFNLSLAKLHNVDKVDEETPFFVEIWLENIRDIMTEKSWGILNVFMLGATLGLLLVFLLSGWPELRKWSIIICFVTCFGFIVSLCFGIMQRNHISKHNEAIVFVPTVMVKSSPDDNGTNLFALHEGTKVKLLDRIGEWWEIKFSDDNIGWIKISDIEII